MVLGSVGNLVEMIVLFLFIDELVKFSCDSNWLHCQWFNWAVMLLHACHMLLYWNMFVKCSYVEIVSIISDFIKLIVALSCWMLSCTEPMSSCVDAQQAHLVGKHLFPWSAYLVDCIQLILLLLKQIMKRFCMFIYNVVVLICLFKFFIFVNFVHGPANFIFIQFILKYKLFFVPLLVILRWSQANFVFCICIVP